MAKRSPGKASVGGRKRAWRLLDEEDFAVAEELGPWAGLEEADAPPAPRARALQVPVMREGEIVHRPDLEDIRDHHLAARAELRPEHLALDPGPPAITVAAAHQTARG